MENPHYVCDEKIDELYNRMKDLYEEYEGEKDEYKFSKSDWDDKNRLEKAIYLMQYYGYLGCPMSLQTRRSGWGLDVGKEYRGDWVRGYGWEDIPSAIYNGINQHLDKISPKEEGP